MHAELLEAGDRTRLVVRGHDLEACQRALEVLRDDPGVLEYLAPAPTSEPGRRDQFGEVTALQDFIVAVAAGVTVETLVAAFKAVLARPPPEEQRVMRTTVDVKVEGPGQVEVSVRVAADAEE
jgi:hypothetical protein